MKRAHAAVILPLALAFGCAGARAQETRRFADMSDREIDQTIRKIHADYPKLEDRIESVGAHFLGTRYQISPLGEGPAGEFDTTPAVDFQGADCTTPRGD